MSSHELQCRLETGEVMIEAEHDLNRRVEPEDYWLRLLKQYKAAVDAERKRELNEAVASRRSA